MSDFEFYLAVWNCEHWRLWEKNDKCKRRIKTAGVEFVFYYYCLHSSPAVLSHRIDFSSFILSLNLRKRKDFISVIIKKYKSKQKYQERITISVGSTSGSTLSTTLGNIILFNYYRICLFLLNTQISQKSCQKLYTNPSMSDYESIPVTDLLG